MHYDLANRCAVGSDLFALQALLDVDIHDLNYALGLTHPRWMALTRKHPDAAIADPTLALLVWAFFRYPDYSFMPGWPDPQAAYALFREHGQHITHQASAPSRTVRVRKSKSITLTTQRAFGYMLGRDHAAGMRWISGLSLLNPVTRRLLYMLVQVCEHEQVAGLRRWYERVVSEARWRGIKDLWIQKSWEAVPGNRAPEGTHLAARRMRYADIIALQQQYGLNLRDTHFALGTVTRSWVAPLQDTPRAPIESPTLSLLLWALLTYPEYSFVPSLVPPQEAYELLRKTAQDMQHVSSRTAVTQASAGRPAGRYSLATRKSFGLLLGSDASSGGRWSRPQQSGAQPEARRLIHFLAQVCQHEGSAGLQTWYQRVLAEANWRGIEDLWEQRTWQRSD